jgi:asparagine synthase (glutamine-hydrolysing)
MLVFNGEIYNHRELRAKLQSRGHTFVSDHCDTEVLLHGYREWGPELPKHLHGMFAFAIWDEDRRRLVLVRDRMGKKPLFVWRSEGEIVFASLVSTLVSDAKAAGRSVNIDAQAMLHFLRLGYTDLRSLIAGVEEVPAAHLLMYEPDGRCVSQQYWRPPPISRTSTSLGARAATREVLEEAVAKRLDADVPLGCFLSGGIDSTVVAALAQQTLQKRGKGPLKTFSVAMPVLDYDESPYARAVARHIGAQHTELTTPQANVLADLEHLVSVIGEPMADSSLLPTYWLSKATRQHVEVALSGDGGDELFGGYDRYRGMRMLQSHRWWLKGVPRGMLGSTRARSWRTRLRRLADASLPQSPARQYQSMIHLFSDGQIAELGVALPADAGGSYPPPVSDWPDEADPAQAAMRWDLMHYLPFDLLRKVDRASMAVALEVRCPILDTQVADLAGHLPTNVLMPGGRPKGLLRQVAAELAPRAIVRRPKRGFAVPIGHWFAGELRHVLADRLFDGGLERIGLSSRVARACYDQHVSGAADHSHRLFALLSLSMWSRWLADPAPAAVLTQAS